MDALGPEVRIVHGHMNYGLHRRLAQAAHYAAVLREPVARTLSHFRLANHRRAEAGREPIPLDRFLACPIAGNLQAEMIAGVHEYEPVSEQKLLDLALAHLETFWNVGVFDDLNAFSTALGVGKLERRNGWGERPDLTPAQEQLVRERTAVDRLLYDMAAQGRFPHGEGLTMDGLTLGQAIPCESSLTV